MTIITKDEVQKWIEFLYKDLCKDNVFIGGYYFNFQQQKELEKIKSKLDKQIDRILDELNNLKDNTKLKKEVCEKLQEKLNNELNDLHVCLKVKNKFGEIVNLPCTSDEFNIVFREFESRKLDVENFKKCSLESLADVEQEDISCFMWYLNDAVNELRHKFAGNENFVVV